MELKPPGVVADLRGSKELSGHRAKATSSILKRTTLSRRREQSQEVGDLKSDRSLLPSQPNNTGSRTQGNGNGKLNLLAEPETSRECAEKPRSQSHSRGQHDSHGGRRSQVMQSHYAPVVDISSDSEKYQEKLVNNYAYKNQRITYPVASLNLVQNHGYDRDTQQLPFPRSGSTMPSSRPMFHPSTGTKRVTVTRKDPTQNIRVENGTYTYHDAQSMASTAQEATSGKTSRPRRAQGNLCNSPISSSPSRSSFGPIDRRYSNLEVREPRSKSRKHTRFVSPQSEDVQQKDLLATVDDPLPPRKRTRIDSTVPKLFGRNHPSQGPGHPIEDDDEDNLTAAMRRGGSNAKIIPRVQTQDVEMSDASLDSHQIQDNGVSQSWPVSTIHKPEDQLSVRDVPDRNVTALLVERMAAKARGTIGKVDAENNSVKDVTTAFKKKAAPNPELPRGGSLPGKTGLERSMSPSLAAVADDSIYSTSPSNTYRVLYEAVLAKSRLNDADNRALLPIGNPKLTEISKSIHDSQTATTDHTTSNSHEVVPVLKKIEPYSSLLLQRGVAMELSDELPNHDIRADLERTKVRKVEKEELTRGGPKRKRKDEYQQEQGIRIDRMSKGRKGTVQKATEQLNERKTPLGKAVADEQVHEPMMTAEMEYPIVVEEPEDALVSHGNFHHTPYSRKETDSTLDTVESLLNHSLILSSELVKPSVSPLMLKASHRRTGFFSTPAINVFKKQAIVAGQRRDLARDLARQPGRESVLKAEPKMNTSSKNFSSVPLSQVTEEDHTIMRLRTEGMTFASIATELAIRLGSKKSQYNVRDRFRRLKLTFKPISGAPVRGPTPSPSDLTHVKDVASAELPEKAACDLEGSQRSTDTLSTPLSSGQEMNTIQRPTTGGKSVGQATLHSWLNSDCIASSEEEDEGHMLRYNKDSPFDESAPSDRDLCHWAYAVKRKAWTSDRTEVEVEWVQCGKVYSSITAVNAAATEWLKLPHSIQSAGRLVSLAYEFDEETGLARNTLKGSAATVRTIVHRFLRTFQDGVLPDPKEGWLAKKVYDVFFTIQEWLLSHTNDNSSSDPEMPVEVVNDTEGGEVVSHVDEGIEVEEDSGFPSVKPQHVAIDAAANEEPQDLLGVADSKQAHSTEAPSIISMLPIDLEQMDTIHDSFGSYNEIVTDEIDEGNIDHLFEEMENSTMNVLSDTVQTEPGKTSVNIRDLSAPTVHLFNNTSMDSGEASGDNASSVDWQLDGTSSPRRPRNSSHTFSTQPSPPTNRNKPTFDMHRNPIPQLAIPSSIYTILDRANRSAAQFFLAKQDAMTHARYKKRYDYVIKKSNEEKRLRALCDALEELDEASYDDGEDEVNADESKGFFDETFQLDGKEVRVWVWQRGLEAPRNI